MASRLSPFLRLARTAAPLRQTIARPLRPQLAAARHRSFATTARLSHDDHSAPAPATNHVQAPTPKPDAYYLRFTCRPCATQSSHNISKQGYHHGSVLVTCPECKNRHVISDHLNIFGDRKITVEDLVREQGGIVRKGTLDEDGDVEFWSEKLAAKTEGEEDVKKEGES